MTDEGSARPTVPRTGGAAVSPQPAAAWGDPWAGGRHPVWYRPRFTMSHGTAAPPGPDHARARALGWSEIAERLDMVLHPVVGTHSGRVLGVEAVIGNAGALGFASPDDLLDGAFDSSEPADPLRADNRLPDIVQAAHAGALRLFAALTERASLKLFLSIDTRMIAWADPLIAHLRVEVERHGIHASSVIVMISERLPFFNLDTLCTGDPAAAAAHTELSRLFKTLRSLSGRLALSDFGAGTASLPLLTLARPDLVKVDRFFVQTQAADRSRRLTLGSLINLVHLMGTQVMAEGVETVDQYHVCRQAGCDYIQGPLVGPPVSDPAVLTDDCADIRALNETDKRAARSDAALITSQTQSIEPITLGTPMTVVFERFRRARDQTFLPAVDASAEPLGIVREADLKEYTYSLYGKDLLSNRALGKTLDEFVVRCPVADVNTKAERILEVFSASGGAECILITCDRQYMGFLSASSLLKVISEKNLAMARDQNPLSRLPGNNMINEYIADALLDNQAFWIIVYLDFDNFKPFNDAYGYRQGDRAITLFAELLRKELPQHDVFVGHVGGDDFFVGFKDYDGDTAVDLIGNLIERFRNDVESFYDEVSRQRGYMIGRDRDGNERHLPLLTASAAVIELPRAHAARSADDIAGQIAVYKKKAKQSASKIARARMETCDAVGCGGGAALGVGAIGSG
ncbi:GGDEF domain-containing protein [Roseospira marina]|nr:GGDEF domain-containing protein [Roseospira marina]MBB4314382.1 diguanylate cyclase (GGDEF)-like protein [Roseospira marina]MBB5087542.1 diguanylate cyclase (GGDEF)-like protein [Roseospira marina]